MSENIEDVLSVEEGDEVTLTTEEGVEIEGVCIEKETKHADSPDEVWTQTVWTIETDDKERYEYGILQGLSPVKGGGDAFPSHFPLTRTVDEYRSEIPDEDNMGFITGVQP